MLSVEDIYKDYEGQPLLRGVSFQVAEGETVCLLGASGSGKSTLLRIIAGLEIADRGRVSWNGQDLSAQPVHLRNFGLMFQDYALFPHRSVAENVAFGLRMQNRPREEIKIRVDQALEQVGMSNFARRRVTDLSGGEQQRVGLARALAPRPRLLMLDEPLGALDRRLREQLLDELHHLLHTTQIPAVYVTHDQEEAFTLADRLVLLRHGRVAQAGDPVSVYRGPASAWVAAFLGLSNQVAGEILSLDPLQVRTPLGDFQARAGGRNLRGGQAVTVLFRPESASFLPVEDHRSDLCGRVVESSFRGGNFRCEIALGADVIFKFTSAMPQVIGDQLGITLDPDGVVAYPREAEDE
jgi:ABC-type Fe3+/spermidine/putrescine transport system ATPase subunit